MPKSASNGLKRESDEPFKIQFFYPFLISLTFKAKADKIPRILLLLWRSLKKIN